MASLTVSRVLEDLGKGLSVETEEIGLMPAHGHTVAHCLIIN